MELLTYKQFPRPMRQIASNSWVREIMYRVDVVTVSDLINFLRSISGREKKSDLEKRSGFWYQVLKCRPVTWQSKITELDKLFPDTKCILNNSFWHFILYTKVKNITPEQSDGYSRYMGPKIDDEQLMAAINKYIANPNELSISNAELEQIHSISGLAALLAGNCQARYHQEQNSAQYLSCIHKVFLVTFALRYHNDFVWIIYQLLKDHLTDDTTKESLPYFDQINNKDSLIEKINSIRNTADKAVLNLNIEKSSKAKLVYLARNQYNPNFSF